MKNLTTNVPEKTEIRKAINKYCEERGLRLSELSVNCGIPDKTLKDIRDENWHEVPQSLLIQPWNYINRNQVDQLYQSVDFISAYNACDKARKYHFMVGITADTGMGKTTALSAFMRQKNVFYISYDKSMNPNQFFAGLLRELSIPFMGTLNEMLNRIAEHLNRLPNPLIIIDEAGKLTHAMILYLHVLRDKTCGNCGIVLAGMPYFKDNLQKMATKEKEGYAEFLRRINIWHSFIGLQPKEVEEICRTHGITDKERIKELKRIKRFGDLMNEIYLDKIMAGDM